MKFKRFLKYLKNPLFSAFLLLVANLVSFLPLLQNPYFFMFGVLGNFFLTFSFAFLTMTIALNLNRVFSSKLFKFAGYAGIGIYFYFYFTWIFSVHYTYAIGYFIMSYGVYAAFKFHTGKKMLSKKDFL